MGSSGPRVGRWGRRYLWACAGAGAVSAVWIAYNYYKWAIVNWDNQAESQ